MAKRLRGWQLELESGRVQPSKTSTAPNESQPATQSALANRLLFLWARGTLSATLIRELADCALQDRADHADLVAIARCGNWGAQPGNIHRQIMGHFCSNVQLAEPYAVEVPCTHPKTSKDALEKASLFLPHLMFSQIATNYPQVFSQLFGFGKGKLADFWTGVAQTGDDKLKGHPMTREPGWQDLCIPLFIHGDGVEYANTDNLLVFSWGSLLSGLGTLQSHWLLASFPKSCTKKETWFTIWKHLQWSFRALASGKHPTTDPDGKPLEKGSPFYPLRGELLHPKGQKGVLWSVIGDHEFFSNTLGLPHWASHSPCWQCDAENFSPCTFGKGYKEICLEKQKFQVRSHAECLAAPCSAHALFKLPHVSSNNVRGDPLHILFCKGLYSHLIGGILHYCCFYEGPRQRTAKKPWERLAVLFSQIQIQYSEQGCKSRMTNMKLSMFCDPQKPWARHPVMDCKGAEARHLLPALTPVIQVAFADTMHACERNMITAATSLEKLVRLWDDMGVFPTAAEYKQSLCLASAFLQSYDWLNKWSLEKDRMSFHVVAKHHSFLHLVWDSQYLNPKLHWCFKGEDFVGQISKLTHSVSMGVSSVRLSTKVAPKYRILIHLVLTRSIQAMEDGQDE